MAENNVEPMRHPMLFYMCIVLIVLELASIVLFGLGFPGDGLQAIALVVFLFTYGIGFGLIVLITGVVFYKKALMGSYKIVAIITMLFGLNALLVYPILIEVNYVASVFKKVNGFARASNEYAWLNLKHEDRVLRKHYKDLQNEFAEPSYVYFGTYNGFQLVGKYMAGSIAVTPFYDLPPGQGLRFVSAQDEQAWLRVQRDLVGKPVIVKIPDFDTYYSIIQSRSGGAPILEPVPAQIYWQGKNILDGIQFIQ